MAAKDDNIPLNIEEENEIIGESSSSTTKIIEKYWPTILIGFATGIITVWISIPFHKCEEIVPGVRTYSCPLRESCEKYESVCVGCQYESTCDHITHCERGCLGDKKGD